MPFDRAYAIENGPSGFDPAAPAYFPKAYFLMLMKNERMAEFSDALRRRDGLFQHSSRRRAAGRRIAARRPRAARAIEAWIAENFRAELRGPPKNPLGAGLFLLRRERKRCCTSSTSRACARSRRNSAARSIRCASGRTSSSTGSRAFSELDWIEQGGSPAGPDARRTQAHRAAAPRPMSTRRRRARHADPALASCANTATRTSASTSRRNRRHDRRRRCDRGQLISQKEAGARPAFRN